MGPVLMRGHVHGPGIGAGLSRLASIPGPCTARSGAYRSFCIKMGSVHRPFASPPLLLHRYCLRAQAGASPHAFRIRSPEQVEKAKACETPEEILALAKDEGYELTDEELDGVAVGWDSVGEVVDRVMPECPECSSRESGGLKGLLESCFHDVEEVAVDDALKVMLCTALRAKGRRTMRVRFILLSMV